MVENKTNENDFNFLRSMEHFIPRKHAILLIKMKRGQNNICQIKMHEYDVFYDLVHAHYSKHSILI